MKLPFPLSLLLPYKRTTEEKAKEALIACGINPDEITWRVGADGVFVFGRKHPDAEDQTDEQLACILGWTRQERIKVGFIGWVTDPSHGS